MNPCMGCILNYQNTKHPICIQVPSENLKGCIISRDSTSDFIEPLSKYKQGEGNLQFENAPPMWLCNRIWHFTEPNRKEMKKLRDFLNIQCYWTHFH